MLRGLATCLLGWGVSTALARENLTGAHDWCLPGQHCKDFDCCALGSSCNTCPHGHESNNYDCAGKGNEMCKGKAPSPSPSPSPAPTPGWCLPGQHCGPLDCCALGSSCNTCPNGYFQEDNYCAGKGDRMCNTELPVSGPSCTQNDEQVPPQGTCKQSLLETMGWDACIMEDGRGDLPSVKDNSKYEVYFMRKTIVGSTAEQHQLAAVMGLFHSAILVQEECAATRETFYIEFFALNFDARLFIPAVVGNTLEWNSSGAVGWYKTFNESEWPGQDAKTYIGGNIPGSVVNAWLSEVPTWYTDHPNYAVWSDFQSSYGDPTPLFQDNQCHEFSEWSIEMLQAKGADFSGNKAPICRNYVPLVGTSYVTKVDVSDPKVFKEITSFYDNLGTNFQKAITDPNDKGQGLKTWIGNYKQWYLVDPKHTQYYHASLSSPYLAADKKFLMRPMMLPWQNKATFIYGTCEWRTGLETIDTASDTAAVVV